MVNISDWGTEGGNGLLRAPLTLVDERQVHPQRNGSGGQVGAEIGVARLGHGPVDRCPDVGKPAAVARHVGFRDRLVPLPLDPGERRELKRGVAAGCGCVFAVLGELGQGIDPGRFAQPVAPESLLPKYRPAIPDTINIGMMHTSLGGAEGHDVYAPCSPADLMATGFDYWALGHIHKRSVVTGSATIVMSGMPQGRDINEDGPKSVTLVSIGDDGTVNLEEKQTALAEFARVTVDATGLAEWSDLASALTDALTPARSGSSAPQLVVRLAVSGETPLAWRMRRDAEVLLAEAEERAARIGGVWIEKLEIGCTPPRAVEGSATDPLHELKALIDNAILGSDAYETALSAVAETLQAQLPTDLRDLFGADETETRARRLELARQGAEDVLARLQPGHATGSETA